MGFLSELVSGAVKICITPIAIIKDVVEVTTGKNDASNTKSLIDSAGKDLSKSIDDLTEGKFI